MASKGKLVSEFKKTCKVIGGDLIDLPTTRALGGLPACVLGKGINKVSVDLRGEGQVYAEMTHKIAAVNTNTTPDTIKPNPLKNCFIFEKEGERLVICDDVMFTTSQKGFVGRMSWRKPSKEEID